MDIQIDQLKLMLDVPKYYLSEYYSNLKNQIDIEFAQKEVKEKHLNEADKNSWMQMIQKIESFETENMIRLNSNQISKKRHQELCAKIEHIQDKINNKENIENMSLNDEIREVKEAIFLNRTIVIFKYDKIKSIKKPVKKLDYRTFYDYYYYYDEENDLKKDDNIHLLVINDTYLDETLFNGSLLTNILYFLRDPSAKNELSQDLITLSCFNEKNKKPLDSIIEISLQLSMIYELDWSSNELNSINVKTFEKFQNLTLIDLSYNKLDKIDDYVFADLPCLKYIWLNNNMIETVGKYAFSGLNNLEWLDLSNNEIISLDEKLFKDLASLETLVLDSLHYIVEDKQIKIQISSKFKNLFIKDDSYNHGLIYFGNNSSNINKIESNKDYTGLFNRNFLKNADAENGFEYWTSNNTKITARMVENSYDLLCLVRKSKSKLNNQFKFLIESQHNVAQHKLYREDNETLYKYFTVLYDFGSKFQLIDLYAEGADESFFEKHRPNIKIGESYAAKNACTVFYYLNVYLISDRFQILNDYSFAHTFGKWENSNWESTSCTFEYEDSFKSLRYVLFCHAGTDIPFGHNALKMTNGYVEFVKSKTLSSNDNLKIEELVPAKDLNDKEKVEEEEKEKEEDITGNKTQTQKEKKSFMTIVKKKIVNFFKSPKKTN